ncbi:hypothetical protein ACHAXH_010078 [Discostella pseudostelligera]
MPPFRSQRIDPYDDGIGRSSTAITSLHHSTVRQRTLVDNGQHSEGSDRRSTFGDGGGHRTHAPGGGSGGLSGNVMRQPQHLVVNSIHDHILGNINDGSYQRHHESVEKRAFPQGHYSAELGHSHSNNSGRTTTRYHDHESGVIKSKTGAAPLTSQLHPLMELRRRPPRAQIDTTGEYNDFEFKGTRPRGSRRSAAASQQHVPTASEITSQMLFILARLMGFIPSRKEHPQHGLTTLSSINSTTRILRLLILISFLTYTTKHIFPPIIDHLTRPKSWAWSGGVSLPNKIVPHRNLAGRNCVMNYFIEKQPPDEYDPDYVDIKPGELNKDGTPKVRPPIKIVEGSYRTKGQVHVISRFIESVANSFRANTKIRQHLIFAEVRDSGHLAYEALKHWPPRGQHRATVHVLASDNDGKENTADARALGYGTLEDIELRFKGNSQARIYDREGNIAGLPDTEGMDDDEVLDAMMEMDAPDQETIDLRLKSGRRRLMAQTNSSNLPEGMRPYPNLRTLLPFEDEDDGEGEIVVPYLHIDGMSMANQMQVLEAARSLFEEKKAVAVGIEHSPDMDVRVLIQFFTSVRYKTFYLGTRQLARIDNLCEEVLDDVLEHPYVKKYDHTIRRFFIRLGFLSKEELRLSGDATAPKGPKRRETPPFFVAMPRGRKSKEEMTIQTMYDLFSGSGGGGQVKTANDRKAPGKK